MSAPARKRSGPAEFRGFAERALRRRWRRYRQELKRCRRCCTEPAVHRLRVSIRRLCSMLEVQAEIQACPETHDVVRRLSKQLGWLGPLRDAHVRRKSLQVLLPRFPELERIIRFLEKREEKLVRQAHRKIGRIDQAKLKRLRARHKKLALRKGSTAERAWVRSLRAIDAAFRVVVQRFERLNVARPDSIHRMRVAFKDFRYRVEALAPVLPGMTKLRLARMRQFQTAMGRIQDREILVELIRSFEGRKRRDRQGLRSVEKLLTRQQSAGIRAFVRSAHRVLDFWEPARRGSSPGASRSGIGKGKK